eukprot:363565-Chlamydomonas_euryale.AAC.8
MPHWMVTLLKHLNRSGAVLSGKPPAIELQGAAQAGRLHTVRHGCLSPHAICHGSHRPQLLQPRVLVNVCKRQQKLLRDPQSISHKKSESGRQAGRKNRSLDEMEDPSGPCLMRHRLIWPERASRKTGPRNSRLVQADDTNAPCSSLNPGDDANPPKSSLIHKDRDSHSETHPHSHISPLCKATSPHKGLRHLQGHQPAHPTCPRLGCGRSH